MPHIKINGLKLYYVDKGKGKTLLFLHSWMSSHEIYKYQIDELSKKYRVIAFDIRGHGSSSKTKIYYRPYAFSRDLHAFIKKLGLKNITLIGSSLGVNIAAHYIVNYKHNVDSLILVNTSAKYISDKGYNSGHSYDLARTMFWHLIKYGYKRVIRRAISNLFSRFANPQDKLDAFRIAYTIPLLLAMRTGIGLIFFDIRDKLYKIKIPALVAYGIEDKLCNFYSAKFWTNNIPNSRLVVFDKSGHYPFIEEKDKFNQEVDNFIKSLNF